MLGFVLRKMLHKKWMVCALLIGNILLIGIACANPMYTQAILQKTLTRSLEKITEETGVCPGTVNVHYSMQAGGDTDILTRNDDVEQMAADYGIEPLELARHYYRSGCEISSLLQRESVDGRKVKLGCMSAIEAHTTILQGRMMSDQPDEDGVIETVASEKTMVEQNLMLDEVLEFPQETGPDGRPIRVRIVGVFTSRDADDAYWLYAPGCYGSELFMPVDTFRTHFLENASSPKACEAYWYVVLDHTQMRTDNAQYLYDTSLRWQKEMKGSGSNGCSAVFSDTLRDYLATAKKVRVTLLVLQVPIFALLAAFVFMVSRQMLNMEQNEIAVLRSRGASRRQLIAIYLIQSLVLSVLGLCAGVPLGVFLTQILGSSNAFLEFVRRKALDIRLEREVFLYAAAAAVFSIAAMVLPVLRFSRETIVSHKQKKHRSPKPFWQKAFLDVAALAVSLYGLYSFHSQKEILAQRVLEGASLDPLLFLSSSLFLVGAGLFAARLIPGIVYLVYQLFRRWWSPALYVSYLQVLRTRTQQSFIVVFLIMTIALGVFNADAARTFNSGEENNIRYTIGADLVLKEEWESNQDLSQDNPNTEWAYTEPDFGRYEHLEGVASATKVLREDNITVSLSGGSLKNVDLMGIHTKQFGQTAWFDKSLLPQDWYLYLNALAQNSHAILVSGNFRDTYGYEIGDTLSYSNKNGDSMRGIIYGFVDYWPSFRNYTYSRNKDGVFQQTEHYLIVASLSQLQAQWGVTPYEIWIKAEGSTQFIYDFAEQSGISYLKFEDASRQIVEKKNDPVFQGTNGILTVGFIVVLLLCMVSFLIYWILSIRSRELQFGIFRAMGMSMGEILVMLLNEHLYISVLSAAVGVLVGKLTGRLFMPLIQMAYAAGDSPLPLRVVSEAGDLQRILWMVGIMLVVCLSVLGVLISRMKIAQALKLGED